MNNRFVPLLMVAALLSSCFLLLTNAVIVPSNILYHIPINVMNQQSIAVSANTPIAIGSYGYYGNVIGFNALKYSQYYTCNLDNAEFFFANGTIATSWLEGNIMNAETANSACTGASSPNALVDSSNILYWVNIPGNYFLPANTGTPSYNTIYLGWTGNTLTAANNLFSSKVGEAPQLSSSYGQYDNGANVFTAYWNNDTISTSKMPTSWVGSVTGFAEYNTPITTNIVWETYAQTPSTGFNTLGGGGIDLISLFGSGALSLTWLSMGSEYSGVFKIAENSGAGAEISNYNTNWDVFGIAPTTSYFGGYWQENYSINYTSGASARDLWNTPGNTIYVGQDTLSRFQTIGWARVRNMPPDDLLPNTTYGAVVQKPIVPSNVVAVQNISLYNHDPTNAIAAGTQVNFTVNALTLSQFANGQFNNWVVFNGMTGNILYSWMEGNTSNEIQVTGLNTVNALRLWTVLPAQIAASTNAVNVLTLGFYPMGTNSMNGNNIGEAPQLSCPYYSNSLIYSNCATYGKFDNGKNVFNTYYNFSGTTLPSSLSLITANNNNQNTIVANGLVMSDNSFSYTGIAGNVAANPSTGIVLEELFYMNQFFLPGSPFQASPYASIGYNGFTTNPYVPSNSVLTDINIGGASSLDGEVDGASSSATYYGLKGQAGLYTLSLDWMADNNFGATQYNGITTSSQTNSNAIIAEQLANEFTYQISYTNVLNKAQMNTTWLRARTAFPNNVAPTEVYGGVQQVPLPAIATITASNSVFASGSTVTFNIVIKNGVGPFNVELWNNTGDTQQGSNVLIFSPGGSNSITFTVNSPTVSNVFVFSAKGYDEGAGVAFGSDQNVAGVEIGSGINPQAIAITPDGAFADEVNYGSPGTMNVISTATNTTVNTISIGYYPTGIAINPQGTLAYVPIYSPGEVKVVGIASNSIVNTIAVGSIPYAPAFNPAGTLAYVPNSGGGTISVIDVASNSVINTITVGGTPIYVVFNPAGTLAYVAQSTGTSSVNVIDVASNSVINTISVGTNFDPQSLAITPDGKTLYIGESEDSAINIFNTSTNTVTGIINLPNNPLGLVMNSAGSLLYVAIHGSDVMTTIDTATNSIVNTITVGTSPQNLGLTPNGNTLYVPNYGSGNVSVVNTGFIITVGPAYTTPSNPSLTLSNSMIDQGQSILFSASVLNGNDLFGYKYVVYNSVTNTPLYTQQYNDVASRSNTLLWTPNPNFYTGNTFAANVVITEQGAYSNTVNTVGTAFGYNSAAIIQITSVSNTLLDSGQYATFNLKDTGGTGETFNAELYNVTGSKQQGSNALITSVGGTNSITIQASSPTNGNVFDFNAVEADLGTSTPFTNNSLETSITVNAAMTTPSITSPSPTTQAVGNTLTWTASFSGGTSPYTYNWIVFNTVTNSVVFNSLISNSFTSNALSWTVPSDMMGNTIAANVIIKDSATTPVSVNSVDSAAISMIVPAPTLSLANSLDMNMIDVVMGSPSDNALITAACSSGDTCQIWEQGGTSLASGTTTAVLAYNALPYGTTGIYANDITGGKTSTDAYNSIVRRISVSHYASITLTNNQGAALLANTPVMLSFNALNFTSWESSSLNNTVLYFGNGTVAYSWLEGNLLNEQAPANELYQSPNAIYWMKSPPTSGFLPANTGSATTNTVRIGFDLPSNNLLDGNFLGEAPQLSCSDPASTSGCVPIGGASGYGQWDNGNSVFTYYVDFSGSSCPSGWTCTSATIGNSISVSEPSSAVTTSDYGLDANQILDIEGKLPPAANNGNAGIGYFSSPYYNTGGEGDNWEINNGGGDCNGPNACAEVWISSPSARTAQQSTSTGYNVWSIYLPSSSSTTLLSDYGVHNTLTISGSGKGIPNTALPIGFSNAQTPGQNTLGPFNWIRLRIYPPSGTMPVATYFTSTTSTSTVSTTTSIIPSSGGGSSGGGYCRNYPTCNYSGISTSTSTSTTTTSTSTSSSTSSTSTASVTTTVKNSNTTTIPQVTKHINLTRQTTVNFNNTNTTVIISSTAPHGNATLTIQNITSVRTIAPPSNLTQLVLLNLTLTTKNPLVNIRFSTGYPCNLNSSQVAPYSYSNNSWHPILPFVSSNQTCRVSFTVTNSAIVGIFYSKEIAAPPIRGNGFSPWAVVVAILIIALVVIGLDDIAGRKRFRSMITQKKYKPDISELMEEE